MCSEISAKTLVCTFLFSWYESRHKARDKSGCIYYHLKVQYLAGPNMDASLVLHMTKINRFNIINKNKSFFHQLSLVLFTYVRLSVRVLLYIIFLCFLVFCLCCISRAAAASLDIDLRKLTSGRCPSTEPLLWPKAQEIERHKNISFGQESFTKSFFKLNIKRWAFQLH